MKRKRALVIGGTGATGPHIVNGLIARGFDVTLFHRGRHEGDEIPSSVERIHGDRIFIETIEKALGQRQFEVAVAMYGRTRLLAQHLSGRIERSISISSWGGYLGHAAAETLLLAGMAVPAPESEPVVRSREDGAFYWRIAETEREVMRFHPHATILRYPLVYGPNQIFLREWSLIRRGLDRRPFLILPDGGLQILTRGMESGDRKLSSMTCSIHVAADNCQMSNQLFQLKH